MWSGFTVVHGGRGLVAHADERLRMVATAGSGGPTLLAGRYELGPLVGVGGTARVYRALDHHTGQTVAVKIYPEGAAEQAGHQRLRETRVLAGLRHPGLVGMLDAGVDGERPFLVMDFVDGVSLRQRLADGPLPADTVTRIGADVADALAYVHANGVVHRDVKPGNVLLERNGRARLTDFGIAKVVDASRVTATGVVVGTAAYMAPEQVRGETVGPAVDIFALGMVLLECVTGRREYEGGPMEVALARLHRPPRVPADVPEPLASTLRAMTARDPEQRPSAASVSAQLRPAPEATGTEAAPVPAGPASARVASWWLVPVTIADVRGFGAWARTAPSAAVRRLVPGFLTRLIGRWGMTNGPDGSTG